MQHNGYIERRVTDHQVRAFMSYDTEHGTLDVTFDRRTGWFGIANITVDKEHRREGIARSLIEQARQDALAEGARVIYAAIISRECILLMQDVFGPDAVTIDEFGTLSPTDGPDRYDANATLMVEL